MSRFNPLFSSSKGNSTYISGGGASLLVDVGIGLRSLLGAFSALDISPKDLSGVLITHEHTDHIRGLPMLLRHYSVPVYGSASTLDFLRRNGYVPENAELRALDGSVVDIDGILVRGFDTPHDACHSMGYKFALPDGRTAVVATDLGHISECVRENISGSDLVMIESNYDRAMLASSNYPYYLKRRIDGKDGHLSNNDCASECVRLVKNGTTRLILAHLSENNNMPQIAEQSARGELSGAGMSANRDYILTVAPARGSYNMVVF